jgi:hypothetical protein
MSEVARGRSLQVAWPRPARSVDGVDRPVFRPIFWHGAGRMLAASPLRSSPLFSVPLSALCG